jgi:hypothetical protein
LEQRKFRKFSQNSFRITYICRRSSLESAVIDLHSALRNSNRSALEVACPPPGIAEISGNFLDQLWNYLQAVLLFECGVVDLHIGTKKGINRPTLEVACPPPGIGAKI